LPKKKKTDKPKSRQIPLMVYPKDEKNIETILLAYQGRDRSASICRGLEDLANMLRQLGTRGEILIKQGEAAITGINLPRLESAK